MTGTGEGIGECRNCGTWLGDVQKGLAKYCPHCGQETAGHAPTFLEFAHEFITHYVALEGKLWKTLGLLFFVPGQLTREYFAGRRKRYIPPLRLYLTASLIFFVVVKLFGVNSPPPPAAAKPTTANAAGQVLQAPPATVLVGPDKKAADIPLLVEIECDVQADYCEKLKTRLNTWLKERYGTISVREFGRQITDRMTGMAPYAMFFLLPVFALLTRLLYWRRPLYYGEHMVYAFHVHAFAFTLLLFIALLPKGPADVLWIGGALYFWLAMRRVFGGRWWATTARYAMIAVIYPTLLVLLIAVILFLAILL